MQHKTRDLDRVAGLSPGQFRSTPHENEPPAEEQSLETLARIRPAEWVARNRNQGRRLEIQILKVPWARPRSFIKIANKVIRKRVLRFEIILIAFIASKTKTKTPTPNYRDWRFGIQGVVRQLESAPSAAAFWLKISFSLSDVT